MIEPLHWSISGILIGLIVPLLLLLANKTFGISGSLTDFWRLLSKEEKFDASKYWKFIFVVGIIFGAAIATLDIGADSEITLAASTKDIISTWGITDFEGLYPSQLFNFKSIPVIGLIIFGGILVGFGARLANGCTSGHCITGISNLQVHSIVVSICFFVGAILMSHLVLPFLIPNVI